MVTVQTIPSPPSVRLLQRNWRWRDSVAAVFLFLATGGIILWQNAHLVVLWDFSYVLETAGRIVNGQMPYRDFPLVHAPLTFLIQAAILRLTGRAFFHHVLYAALVGGLSTVLAWRIGFNVVRRRVAAPWGVAAALAAPLIVLGIYCILPLPNYDCDCGFALLIAIWLLQKIERQPSLALGIAAGLAICVPVFFKQNMGLPFLAAAVGAVVWLLGIRVIWGKQPHQPRNETAALLGVLAGSAAALAATALALHFTMGIRNSLHWTIQFAAQRRLPGVSDMLGIYREPNLLWMLPGVGIGFLFWRRWAVRSRWARVAAFALFAAPFVFTLGSLLLYEDADERAEGLLALWPLLLTLALVVAVTKLVRAGRQAGLRELLPFVLLAAIHGTLLSQQLWGSTYAIWPLLLLLVAELAVWLAETRPADSPSRLRFFPTQVAVLVAVTFLVCGQSYMSSEERLSYAQFPDGPAMHSAFPQLAGMATPGPYLPEFDELLRYAETNIPWNDGIVLTPGEDPFYFVTGRVPQFPVLLFDPATDPYSPAELAQLVQTRGIHWLIVKRDLQIVADPTPDRDEVMKALLPEFAPAAHLRGYDIYRR